MPRSTPKPQDEPQPEVVQCPVPTLEEAPSGVGGSYVLDPTTGQRKLIHQTKPALT